MPLIPALGRQISVSSRPVWSTRASSRTGSRATEKPCLEEKKIREVLYGALGFSVSSLEFWSCFGPVLPF